MPGSIVPVGPAVQYATERPWDRLLMKVYPGCDASFRLYEDENDSYRYEDGLYSTIDFQWDEARRTLTIGPHEGRYPGMLEKRVFDIELVEQGRGGFDREGKPVKTVTYRGKPLTLKF